MAKNTGKVREKSRNFVTPEKWEPCMGSKGYQCKCSYCMMETMTLNPMQPINCDKSSWITPEKGKLDILIKLFNSLI